ncbi:hypothetical protein [Henriciella aquimarina]|uniref:hypothetical protein n=1 Tax=Henriciella aquimarina TaxID=545261 RepID=UPI000A06BB39|nr:hypothetical protein [Henriciella aquimarina]
MEDAINSIPPDAWPVITILFNVTCAVTALWLVWTVFVLWRRRASNLTTASGASPNRKATPDFLSIDEKAREEALKRGEAYETYLDKRDRDEARAAERERRRKETMISRFGRLISFGMALFSLATMISGTMFQVSIMGRYWEQYSAGERLTRVVQEHPVGVTVTVAVILFNIITFVSNRKWES